MKYDNYIGNLITKFKSGGISHEELAVLVKYFREKNPGSELTQLYNKAWEDSLQGDYKEDTTKTYQELLNIIKPHNRKNKIFTLSVVLKYAAVFVFAFSIAWFLSRFTWDSHNNSSYQNIEVPYGSKTKIELPDGSRVTLNSGSKLRYAKNFGDNARTVFLEGEAFFDVKKDKHVPFYVHAAGIKVKVLGTTFNVKAYPEEKTIETTLITGQVELYKEGSRTEKTPLAILTPNQKAVYEKSKGELVSNNEEKQANNAVANVHKSLQIEKNINTELSTAWKDNEFIFDNERFGDLIKRIERWYNVDVELNYAGLKDARFSGKFDKETIEQAMQALTIVTPFHFKMKKNKVEIYQ